MEVLGETATLMERPRRDPLESLDRALSMDARVEEGRGVKSSFVADEGAAGVTGESMMNPGWSGVRERTSIPRSVSSDFREEGVGPLKLGGKTPPLSGRSLTPSK